MRKTTLVLNSIIVVFFAGFLAYTLIARQHLTGLARGFVTEKTVVYSKPIVDVADDSLKLPFVQKLIPEDKTAAIRREIADYRNDPSAYISDLTRQKMRNLPVQNANPLLAKVDAFKEKIREFYDDTLNALIKDLRIFSVSNLIAGLIAFVLAFRSHTKIRQPIVWFSFLMFVAVLYCSSLYVDDLTFFSILFRAHMGWWYPLFLCAMVVAMYLDLAHGRYATEQMDEPE
jgi:hypothetical protein